MDAPRAPHQQEMNSSRKERRPTLSLPQRFVSRPCSRSELGPPELAGRAGVSGPPSPGRGAIAHHRSPPSPIPPPAFPAASTVGCVPTVSSRLTLRCPARLAGDTSPIPFSHFYRPVLALYVARVLARTCARARALPCVCWRRPPPRPRLRCRRRRHRPDGHETALNLSLFSFLIHPRSACAPRAHPRDPGA